MKRIVTAAVVLIAVGLLAASCSATLRGAGGGGVVTLYPTAEPLVGELPVGRWACVSGNLDFEENKKSNRGSAPRLCDLYLAPDAGAIALHPDESGFLLKQYQRR